jgi:hypothetical protein
LERCACRISKNLGNSRPNASDFPCKTHLKKAHP